LKEEYIMNTIYKTKADRRQETSEALQMFLARGGQITVAKPRKTPKSKMSGKSSRGFRTGTSGFATGFPNKSF